MSQLLYNSTISVPKNGDPGLITVVQPGDADTLGIAIGAYLDSPGRGALLVVYGQTTGIMYSANVTGAASGVITLLQGQPVDVPIFSGAEPDGVNVVVGGAVGEASPYTKQLVVVGIA